MLQRRTSLRTLQTRATKKIQANKTHAKKHKKQKPSKDNDKKNKKSKEKVKPTQNSKTAITYSNGSMKDAQTLLDTTQEIEMETIEVTVEVRPNYIPIPDRTYFAIQSCCFGYTSGGI